jgi:hypothetical protein
MPNISIVILYFLINKFFLYHSFVIWENRMGNLVRVATWGTQSTGQNTNNKKHNTIQKTNTTLQNTWVHLILPFRAPGFT